MGDVIDFPASLKDAAELRRTIAKLRALLDDGASQNELRALLDAHFEQLALRHSTPSHHRGTQSNQEPS